MTGSPSPAVDAETVVYRARLVRTLDRGRPVADAVAVRGGRVLAVGSLDELAAYGPARLDDRFADHVIVPGFVEAHTHVFGARLWEFPYLGYFDRTDTDGHKWSGCTSISAVVDRLREAEAKIDGDEMLVAWGFDSVYLGGERLCAADLDRVSRTRPIFVLHASSHVASVNTAALEVGNVAAHTNVVGVVVDRDGRPDGELQEPAAMSLVPGLGRIFAGADPVLILRRFAREAASVGCTTVVDLGTTTPSSPEAIATSRAVVDEPDFPVRLSSFLMAGRAFDVDSAQTVMDDLRGRSSDAFRVGHIKIVLDGSIQQRTARLLPPGYLDREARGIWVMAPETFRQTFTAFHVAGALIHVHCNGDEATELFLDVLADALEQHPRWDHRHTVTHSQLTTASQYRRLAALGGCANIFANHIWYWGDQHRDIVIGPDRAARMDAAATAIAAGVPISLHCDTPVTPISPLASMHHAVNRRTATGRSLGPDECITPAQALEAMTLGSAFMLRMDHEIGSIQAGKFADLAVLDADPLTVAPDGIADIGVVTTARSGVFRE
ncbi:MAG: amidohydrolase [Acidimicrobiia bacterium]|nr:amidohydrolase [Acidimicrobiia bacterium]